MVFSGISGLGTILCVHVVASFAVDCFRIWDVLMEELVRVEP